MEKKCTKCGEVKPLDLFYADKRNKDGKQSECKECTRERGRKWRLENPEKSKERFRKWCLENPEKVREAGRKWRDSLSDGYVTKMMKASGLPPEIIEANPELIELKRLQIQLNRKINQKKKEL